MIDHENETEIVSFRDVAFPSLSFAFLEKTIQIVNGKENANVNENVIDGCLFLFVFHLNVNDLARRVIQHGRCEIHRVRFSCL